ncbi:MAG: hypothetical protein V3S56_01430 [Gemmatimonadota bacterium]
MNRCLRVLILAVPLAWAGVLVHSPDVFGQASPDLSRFQHEFHATYECAECHSTGAATTVSNRKWCTDCHHVDVGYAQCQRCHTAREIAPEPVRAIVRFRLPPAELRTRSLIFDHNVHGRVGCASCHTGGAALRAEAGCESCHTDHHKAGVDCQACHSEPPVTAHPEEVHLDLAGCGTAGCHVAEGIDYAAMLDERNLCVSCHVAQREHEQPAPCAECHLVSEFGDTPGDRP